MRHCEICGKTSRMAGTRILLRGHYNPTNWSRKYPNLQKTVTPAGVKVLACTQCIRTFGKADRMAKKMEAKTAAKAKETPKAEEKKPEAPKEEKPAEKPKKEPKAKKESKKETK